MRVALRESGYYSPIIFFFIDELEMDEDPVKKINAENKWFQYSKKLAISFSDCSEKFINLLAREKERFSISKEMDASEIDEFVKVFCNTITRAMFWGNFPQTGQICAKRFRDTIDSTNEDSDAIVFVDPIEEDSWCD